MKRVLFILLLPISIYSQDDVDRKVFFTEIPYKEGKIIYEQIVYLQSLNDKQLVFNAAKSALISNTAYKYDKIDEDRISGSISTTIRYDVATNSAIRFVIDASSLLTIDVKENRFRIRVLNSSGIIQFMGERYFTTQSKSYEDELKQIEKGKKAKSQNSISVMWDKKIKDIIKSISEIVANGVSDDF